MSDPAARPSKPNLFKYQAFNAQNLANLTARSIYVAPPSAFNDPFDCKAEFIAESIDPKYLGPGRARIKELASMAGKDGVLNELAAFDEAKLEAMILSAAQGALVQHQTDFMSKKGIACFGSSSDNLLMWGHYADGHRGFCIEIDASTPPWSTAYDVHYSDQVPRLDPGRLLADPDLDELFRVMVLTKAKCWQYEQERRLLHEETGKLYGYGAERLSGIVFGAKMNSLHREILCKLLHGSPTKLYQMSLAKCHFGVVSEEKHYTPNSFGTSAARE